MKQTDFLNRALNLALKTLDIKRDEVHCPEIYMRYGVLCLNFQTDFQRYECMLDRKGSKLLGINSVPDNSGCFEKYKYY